MDSVDQRALVKSMTGFARGSIELTDSRLEVELRSVNHRFLDVGFRGPRELAPIERELRSILLQTGHRRGRFDLTVIRDKRAATGNSEAWSESPRIMEAITTYSAACKRYGVSADGLPQFIGELLMRNLELTGEGVEISADELTVVRGLVVKCSELLLEERGREGQALVADVRARISAISSMREAIAAKALGGPNRFKQRLSERLAGLDQGVRIDPERLALEVALLADRVDISEELSRLGIHLEQFDKLLSAGHPEGVGRKLDFMIQEIGRELNTIGSKAQDAQIQGMIVESKAELERVREQVQNIE